MQEVSVLLLLLSIFMIQFTISNAGTTRLAAPPDNNNNKSVEEIEKEKKQKEEKKKHDYLYHDDDATIINDYDPLPYEEGGPMFPANPDFLYAPNQTYRIVEYYAPWCPHCKHFRKHYIEFAYQLKTIIDEYNININIEFYAISCTVHGELCRSQGIHGYPKVKVFTKNAIANCTEEIPYWKLHPIDILHSLQIPQNNYNNNQIQFIDHNNVIATNGNENTNLRTNGNNNNNNNYDDNEYYIWPKRSKQILYNDAYLSFYFNLRTGIFIDQYYLTNTTSNVLKDWLLLVQKSTPIIWYQIHNLITDIIHNFDTIKNNDKHLMDILDKYQPTNDQEWSISCTKGESGMGYTCGLWQLLHIISIGVVEYNMMIGSQDNTYIMSDMSISTVHAGITIRNFIEHFFACDYCRTHFITAYDTCALDRCERFNETFFGIEQWRELPIWLWETHNNVNARLLKEKKPSIKNSNARRFPSSDHCPLCFNSNNNWDDELIYKFLRTEYWIEDYLSSEYRAEFNPQQNGRSNNSALNYDFTNNNTTSLLTKVIPILTMGIVIIFFWYTKAGGKQRIRNGGWHKKFDDGCNKLRYKTKRSKSDG